MSVRERRVLASWRTRACAAGMCVGAQVFLAGCAVGMPLALSSAWLAALGAIPFGAWLTVRCRRRLCAADGGRLSRAGYLLLALSLLGSAAFAAASLVGFAAQTLVQQSRPVWTETAALAGILLCALSGGTGAARLCFALRWAIPLLTLGLSLTSVPMRVPVGLFPILGAGAGPLAAAAACMLFGAAPALMLMTPPPEIAGDDGASLGHVPGVHFFLSRVIAGALAGVLLLFLTCACTTYESIAQSSEWGARLRMAAGNQPHEGILQMILMLFKLLAMQLLAVNMLCAAQQALGLAVPALRAKGAGLLAAGLCLTGALAVTAIAGDGPMLVAAPLLALAAMILGRRNAG